MTERKTVNDRIAGFSKSERVDARFLLLGLAPFTPIIFADEMGWERGLFWYLWFGISVVWFLFLWWKNLAAYWRALRRSSSGKR